MSKFLRIRLAAALFLAFAVFALTGLALGFAQREAYAVSTGDGSVYFTAGSEAEKSRMFGGEEVFNASHSGMAKLTVQGGATANDIARSVKNDDYLTYTFDLDDTLTTAALKVCGTLARDNSGDRFVVSYSVDGGTTFSPLTIRGNVYNTGTYFYDLTEQNALKSADNTFLVKFTVKDGFSAAIYSVFVGNLPAESAGDSVVIEPFTEAYSRHIVSNSLEYVYFANGVTPMYYILQGGNIVYYYDLPDSWTNAVYSYTGTVKLTAEYSADGENFTAVKDSYLGKFFKNNPGRKFYLKWSSPDGQDVSSAFKITKSTEPVAGGETVAVGKGTNANADAEKDSSSVYFEANADGEKSYRFFTSEYAFADTTSGTGDIKGDSGNNYDGKGWKLASGDSVAYEFDLADTFTKGTLKLFGTLALDESGKITVEYSTDGGETYTALVQRGSIYNTGTYFYDLTADNALKNAGKTFRIRITSSGAVCLGAAAIVPDGAAAIEQDSATVNPMTAEHLKYLVSNKLEYEFFADRNTPMWFILNGGHLVFRFDLPNDWTNAKVSVGGDGALGISVSKDGTAYEEIPASYNGLIGKAFAENENRIVWVKFSASGANALNKDIKIQKSTEPVPGEIPEALDPGEGENVNKDVPANRSEVYFKINTAEEQKFYFFNSEKTFDSTHRGLSLDDPKDGWAKDKAPNARRLDNGDYLVYDFNLADGISNALLKVYASSDLKFEYSADLGKTFSSLTPTTKPYHLGYFVFELNSDGALKNDNRTFRLRISSAKAGQFFDELMIQSGETAAEESLFFTTHGEDMIRYLYSGTDCYTYVGYGKNAQVFLTGKDVAMTFKFTVKAGVTDALVLATLVQNQPGDVEVQISKDNKTYTKLFASVGGGGTPPSQQADISSYLSATGDTTLYVRAISTNGQCFFQNIGISIPTKAESSGSFKAYSKQETGYAVNLSGTVFQNTSEESELFRAIPAGSSAVYRIKLPAASDRVQLKFRIKGPYVCEVSSDGTNYLIVKESGSPTDPASLQTANVYDPVTASASRTLYVRFKSASDPCFLAEFSFGTANVPEKPHDDEPDADDSLDFDYTPGGTPDKFPMPESPEIPGGEKIENPYQTGCGSQKSTSGLAVLLLGGVLLAGLKIKR